MIDRVFGIKVRMSGLSINRYRPIIGRPVICHCLIGASLIIIMWGSQLHVLFLQQSYPLSVFTGSRLIDVSDTHLCFSCLGEYNFFFFVSFFLSHIQSPLTATYLNYPHNMISVWLTHSSLVVTLVICRALYESQIFV